MLVWSKALVVDIGSYSCGVIVRADSDESDLITPDGAVFLNQFLKLRHGPYGGRAPAGPKNDQRYLSFLDLESDLFVGLAVDKTWDRLDGTSGMICHRYWNSFSLNFIIIYI